MVLRLLVDIRFQVLFHSPPGVLFTFPSRYSSLSVVQECLALDGGPPGFPQGFTCPVVLWIPAIIRNLSLTGVSPSVPYFPKYFSWNADNLCRSATPEARRSQVWALPVSLAATKGISFDFFSSDYLDVSVHRVVFLSDGRISPVGLPHSDIHGSVPACGSPCLFAAYRVLLRL